MEQERCCGNRDSVPREMRTEGALLCLDIGGTAVKIARIGLDGVIHARSEAAVDFDSYRTPILESCLKESARFLKQTLSETGGEAPLGIAISATGQIDSREGKVAGTCGNLPGWAGTALEEAFRREFRLPVTVANDANCMVLGEAWLGAARGFRDVIGITLGTGVGGGILVSGRLLEGQRGLAGELGHIPLLGSAGARCTCGMPGCFERYASTSALLRTLSSSGYPYANARELCRDLSERQIRLAGVQATAADLRQIQGLFEQWRSHVALGIAGLIHLFNPEIVLIGGGISAQEDLLIRPLREEVFSLIMPEFRKNLKLCAAGLLNNAGLIGACAYFLRHHPLSSR